MFRRCGLRLTRPSEYELIRLASVTVSWVREVHVKVLSLVAVSIVSVMASVGAASAMPVGSPANPSLIEKAQVVVQKTVTTVVRRRPAVIVKRPVIVKKTVIIR